jgi:hypothetical protein
MVESCHRIRDWYAARIQQSDTGVLNWRSSHVAGPWRAWRERTAVARDTSFMIQITGTGQEIRPLLPPWGNCVPVKMQAGL